MLLRRAWDGGCFNGACGGMQDGKLRLRHAFALTVDVDEGVVAVAGAHVDQCALRSRRAAGVRLVEKTTLDIFSIMPFSFGLASVAFFQICRPVRRGLFGIDVAFEDTGLLVVEVFEGLRVSNAELLSSSKKASSVPTTSAFSRRRRTTRSRRARCAPPPRLAGRSSSRWYRSAARCGQRARPVARGE